MKTKLTGLLIVLSIAIISCDMDIQQENNDLLTSSIWIGEREPLLNGAKSKWPDNHFTFHKNGDYTYEAGEIIKIAGKWKWIDKNEICISYESVTIEGKWFNFDEKNSYYIRILEISEGNLKTLERLGKDTWDSGFTKEKTYKSS
ncbi:MAG TPA: hypothetical protein VFU05_03835 [Cyclobacteriaceae bacterium]|nr:hypothetical protein [Cyclobacteriaceae bacterium]